MSRIRIVLDEGPGFEGGNTWVTVVPINQLDERGVWRAVDEAAEWFKMSVARDPDTLRKRLQAANAVR